MSNNDRSASASHGDFNIRSFLLWCLPALLIGLAFRVALTVDQPYAYFHDDAPDFLCTPDRLLNEGRWELHQKKTFLSPILFTIPFYLPGPALITIPILQHLLGLGSLLLAGALTRFWFRAWKVWIIPLTMVMAVNPYFVWYEHTIMAESHFLFCTLLLALAGTLYALEHTKGRFAFLLAALVLEAGARPEGKLLFGFALLLLLIVHFRDWKAQWPRFAIFLLVAAITNQITKTSQAGLLLFTSVARLTPEKLWVAPGFDPYIAPIRADLERSWQERVQFPRVNDRRKVSAAVKQYMKDHPGNGSPKGSDANRLAARIAFETCLKNFGYLPVHAYHKFRLVANDPPSLRFDNNKLFDKQREAYFSHFNQTLRLAKKLTGIEIKNATELHRFIDTHYGEIPWFNRWHDGISEGSGGWTYVLNFFRFPDRQFPNKDFPLVPHRYPGIPYYFLIAAIGLLVAMFRPGQLRAFHIAWGLTLLAFFYVIILTANVRPRFRFVFEPFWYIYIALLIDSIWMLVRAPFRR